MNIKKTAVIIWCWLLAVAVNAQTASQKIDELLAAYASQYKFNGAVLVAQKDKVIFEKGYGWKNAAQQTKNDDHTIFQIGSITKQFTSAVIMQLQQEKKLSVQDKLSKYFPDFPNGDKITIENLLTHTSGIYNYTNDPAFMQTEAVKPATQDKMLALFKDKPLDFEPGSKFSYSNSGYMLLGYIIEKVAGKTYFQAVRERIFKPLHMEHSGFDFTGLSSPDKATGYNKLTAKENEPSGIVDSSVAFAAGAIYTTVDDLYKWNRAMFAGKVLNATSLKQAYTPFKGYYAYGWVIDTANGQKEVSHGGGIFGFTSYISRKLNDETCVILFDNHGSGSLSTIAGNIRAILNNRPYDIPHERKEIALDTATLRQYTGQYQLAPNFIITITLENGKLMGQPSGQPKSQLYAEKENFFFLKVVDAQVEFVKGADGKIEKMILHQNGQDAPAPKIN